MTTPGETEEGQSSDPQNNAIAQEGYGILLVVVVLPDGFGLGPTTPVITITLDARGTTVPRTDTMTRIIVVTPMTKPGRARTVGTGRVLGTCGIVGGFNNSRRKRGRGRGRGRSCHQRMALQVHGPLEI